MHVYLMRHTQPATLPGRTDAERFLTQAGRESATAVGRCLQEHGVQVQTVISSPLMRAVQTAELCCRGLGFDGVIESSGALVTGDALEELAALLRERESTLVVGHAPLLSTLGSLLAPGGFPDFSKGEVMAVQDATLAWRLDPRALEIHPGRSL